MTGPDEYMALTDNNVYTNLMAARNLRTAADLATHHPLRAAELGVDEEEIASWRDAAHGGGRSRTTTSCASRRSPRRSPATATGRSTA